MKWIKSYKVFENTGPYLPTIEELSELPMFKELKKFSPAADWGKPSLKAYQNGTRQLIIIGGGYYFYPYKETILGSLVGSQSYTIARNVKYDTLIDWDNALFKVLCHSLSNIPTHWFEPNVTMEPEIFARMLKLRRTQNLKAFLAGYKSTPDNILRDLAEKGEYFIEISLASNPNAPRDLINGFVESDRFYKDAHLRSRLARNPNLNPKTYRKIYDIRLISDSDLTRYSDSEVITNLLKNPGVPQDLIIDIMLYIASIGPSLNHSILTAALDVIERKRIPVDTLIKLSRQALNSEIATAAKKSPDFPDDLTSHVLDLF